MLNIYADSNIPYINEALEKISNLRFFDSNQISNAELVNTEVLFTRTALKVNQQLLANTAVRFVATATSGIDHFDMAYLKENNILFDNALGSNANSVAEYVIYSILKYVLDNNDVKEISQIKSEEYFRGKTIGIIGFGCVGSQVAIHAEKLGLKILINDPPKKDAGYEFPKQYQYVELNELLKSSDIVTNHVPLDCDSKYKTIDLLNLNNMSLIKENALFIHASRGKIVNEDTLLELKRKKNFTLVIDVWSDEPIFNIELFKETALATPHIAGHSLEGKVLGTKMILKSLEKYFPDNKPNYTRIDKILNNNKKALANYSSIIELHEQIKKFRDLEEDNVFMTKIMKLSRAVAGNEFLKYRQEYPVRHEFLQNFHQNCWNQ